MVLLHFSLPVGHPTYTVAHPNHTAVHLIIICLIYLTALCVIIIIIFVNAHIIYLQPWSDADLLRTAVRLTASVLWDWEGLSGAPAAL